MSDSKTPSDGLPRISTQREQMVRQLRYMARQYSAGQFARGGGVRTHWLADVAGQIEQLEIELAAAEQTRREEVHALVVEGRKWQEYAEAAEQRTMEAVRKIEAMCADTCDSGEQCAWAIRAAFSKYFQEKDNGC